MCKKTVFEQIIAEALEILESEEKTAEDMTRLVQLSHELEERRPEGGMDESFT